MICWDLLQSVGALFTVWWFFWRAWSSRETLLQLMDDYHPPIPPFRRCQTHRPTYFIQPQYGTRACRRLAVVPDADDDDRIDEFLTAELECLRLRRFLWFDGWTLADELFEWWLFGLSLLPPFVFQVLSVAVTVFGWLSLLLLPHILGLLTEGWMDDISISHSGPSVDELSLLLVVGYGALAASLVVTSWLIWCAMSLLLAAPPSLFSLAQLGHLRRALHKLSRLDQEC